MPAKRAAAVVFIHGLAKKPPVDKLREIWLWGLTRDNPMPTVFLPPNPGIDLATKGVPQSFNYYADVFYGTNYETEFDAYYEANEAKEIEAEGLTGIEPELQLPVAVTPRETAFLVQFETKLQAAAVLAPAPIPTPTSAGAAGAASDPDVVSSSKYEIASWLPGPVKQTIIKKAAMEAFYFLFNKEYVRPGPDQKRFQVRQELRSRLLGELTAAQQLAEQVVIVSHSMGTMVAYDVLRNCPECPHVDTLFTLGSPLGIQEVQDELIASDASTIDFPAARLDNWINIYDPLDPICAADPILANDYAPVDGKKIVDVKESNWGSWRHTITHYLAGAQFRARLMKAVRL